MLAPPVWTSLAPVLLSAGAFSCAWLLAGLLVLMICSALRGDDLFPDLLGEPGQLLMVLLVWPLLLYLTVLDHRDGDL